MKTKLILFILIIFIQNGWSQEILDKATPHIILDYLYLDSTYYRLESAGSCMGGVLTIESPDSIQQHFLGFTTNAKFSYNKNQWVALCNSREADDVGYNYLKIIYQDETGQIRSAKTGEERQLWFSSFTLLNDSLLLVQNMECDSLYVIDLNGNILQSNPSDKSYHNLGIFQGNVLALYQNEIDVYDTSLTWIKKLEFSSTISDFKTRENVLYLLFDTDILHLDGAFQTIRTYDDLSSVLDLSFRKDTMVVMYKTEEKLCYHIWFHNGEVEGLELFDNNDFPHLSFQKFIANDPSLTMYGVQKMTDPVDNRILHGVTATLHELYYPSGDYSIHIDSLEESKDIYDYYIDANGDTLFIYDYIYTFSYTISNESVFTLQDCYVQSSRKHAVNCAYTFYQKHFENLNLEPGESISIEAIFNPGYIRFEDFCLHLVSGNHDFERYFHNIDFSNNSSCRNLVGTKEINKNHIFVYPNPVGERLYFSKPLYNSGVQVTTLEGQVLYNTNTKQISSLDLSGYPPGIYILRLVNKSGKSIYRKFVKI